MKVTKNSSNGNGNNVAKTSKIQVVSINNRRAINAPTTVPQVVEMTDVFKQVQSLSSLTVENGYLLDASGCYYSPFGHGKKRELAKMANNAQIDVALCQGAVMIDILVSDTDTPSRVCNRHNEYDIEKRPECNNTLNQLFTLDLIYNHLAFLSGKGNGKNSLQKRLLNTLDKATIEQVNDIASQVHEIITKMWVTCEHMINTRDGSKKHSAQQYQQTCEISGTYGRSFSTKAAIV